MTQQEVALMVGGILVVFLVLGLLILFISILGWIMVSVEKRLASRSAASAAAADPAQNGEFVAAVTAAINKVNPVEDGRSIRIKNIRKV